MATGLPLPSAADTAFATMADDWSNAHNDGFVKDETINTGSGAMTTNATYASATTFTVSGDATATYTPSRRLRIVHAGGTTYCRVAAATFSGGTTTVTIAMVSSGPTVMTSAITSVSFGAEFGGSVGNAPNLGEMMMLRQWGL